MENQEFYPELTEEGKLIAQEIMTSFENKLKARAVELMQEMATDFYCNALQHIESDSWVNFRTQIVNAICDYSNREKTGSYDFDRIRKSIYSIHKEEIVKDLNQDLLKEIETLKGQLKEAYRFR